MDPAHNPSPLARLDMLEEAFRKHQATMAAAAETQTQALAALAQQMQLMAGQLSHLSQPTGDLAASEMSVGNTATDAGPSPPAISSSKHSDFVSRPLLAPPDRFTGEPKDCEDFIIHCEMHFELLPTAFASERAKVAFVISHLAGRAKTWAATEWAQRTAVCASVDAFFAALRQTFNPTSSEREKARELSTIQQGSDSVTDYAIRFRTLATDCGWNETALYDIFFSGLSRKIRDILIPVELPTGLAALIALAVRTDNRLQESSRAKAVDRRPIHRAAVQTTDYTAGLSAPQSEEPMQLGRTTLTQEEKEHRRRANLCLYCGGAGHFVSKCPVKARAHQ